MEDNVKQLSSYQQDQEILDARGITMTVEEVAGLPTCKYLARLRQLKLPDDDKALLKSMRRRIKNRLASQNSRRRSMEHLRRLTRELRAVRACRNDALAERRVLIAARDKAREACENLRIHLCQTLQEREDTTEVPSIDVQPAESHTPKQINNTVKETKTPIALDHFDDQKKERDKTIFECKLEKLVQQSVNHIYKGDKDDKRKIFAKTVFLSNDKINSDVKSVVITTEFENDGHVKEIKKEFELDSDMDDEDGNSKEFWIDSDINGLKSDIKTQMVCNTTLKIPDVSKRNLQNVFNRNLKKNGGIKIQDIFKDKAKTNTVFQQDVTIPIVNGGLKSHNDFSTITNGDYKTHNIFKNKIRIEDVFKNNKKYKDVSIEEVLKKNGRVQHVSNGVVNAGVKVGGAGGDKMDDYGGVLNLCVKRRSHGRKQSAPRRIAYTCEEDDIVLDLKIKKEPE